MTDESVRRYARTAGFLLLLSIVAGGFGEVYVPGKLIASANPAATAASLRASNLLFRASFASYLVEAVCDIALALVLYVLLSPVSKNLSLLAAFFGIVSTAVFAVAELFYFSSLLFTENAPYLKTFSADQLNTFIVLFSKVHGYGGDAFMVFYGVASLLRGYLIFRSDYLPKLLGALLALAGLGFIVKNFLLVLAPRYATDILLLPMFLAVLSLGAWLLVRGVDVAKWQERARAQ